MRKIFLTFLLLTSSISIAQVIDTTIYGTWPEIVNGSINNKGNYCSFTVQYSSFQKYIKSYLVIQDTSGKWSKNYYKNINSFQFVTDGIHAIVSLPQDSIEILTLGTTKNYYLTDIKNFKLFGSILIYQTNKISNTIYIKNLKTDKLTTYSNIFGFFCQDNTQSLILRSATSNNREKLTRIDLDKNKSYVIGEFDKIQSLIFDQTGNEIAFKSEYGKDICIFNNKEKRSTTFIADSIFRNKIFKDLQLSYFSPDGNNLIIELISENQTINKENKKDKPYVEIWNYNSPRLNNERTPFENESKSEYAIINLEKKQAIPLTVGNQAIIGFNHNNILINDHPKEDKIYYGTNSKQFSDSVVLFSAGTGVCEKIMIEQGVFSPSGKFIIHYDSKQNNYYTYETKTKKIVNITKQINTTWTKYGYDKNRSPEFETDNLVWGKNDDYILINDQNDIWRIDPTGKKSPINITMGIGKKNNIIYYLSIIKEKNKGQKNEAILIPAFNRTNKDNGFYYVYVNGETAPEKLTMSQDLYYITSDYMIKSGGLPVKAKDADVWMVMRMNASESPNYFITTDFINFKPVSNIHPERNYNWLTSELHTWNSYDGRKLQGILYKPKDFDPNRKYPIIFYYYEKLSDNLNAFISPDIFNGPINIPWFVSRDYLVFTPDIYYKFGYTGESALNSIASAGEYMASKPYVNSKKMGLQGHSFGGYETNYVITHSNLFAAACAASSVSNFVSGYNSIGGGRSLQGLYEIKQNRMQATLWEKPDLYIKNSPIFNLDKVTTPLLIMHTTEDKITLLPQALELFTGLRRLGKKSWLLLYNNENHTLMQKQNGIDYTLRVTQFFDYYLKDKPAPKWMLDINSPSVDDISEGFQYDSTNQVP